MASSPRDDLAEQSWLPHATLIPATLDALASEDPEVAANASQLICALLSASSEPPACLEEGDAGRERCAQLVRICLGDEVGDPPNLPALEVVLQLLFRLRDMGSSSPVMDSLLSAVELDIERFFAALAAPSPLPARFARFFSADAPAFRPRSQQRCKVLLLIEEGLKSERPALITPLYELGLFSIVIDLLLMPHTCNALHMRAAAIIEWAISLSAPATTLAPQLAALVPEIRKSLLIDAQLTHRLLALVDEYAPTPSSTAAAEADAADGSSPVATKPKKVLPCCHAFVMHLGACLLGAAQREPEVRTLLEECKGWNAFIAPSGPLTTWESRCSRPLGGLAPTRGSDDSDDDEELDAATMERMLAAQAAARDASLSSGDGDNDDEDDEGAGHSSEYLQHFAHYLSNHNFLNQVHAPPPLPTAAPCSPGPQPPQLSLALAPRRLLTNRPADEPPC